MKGGISSGERRGGVEEEKREEGEEKGEIPQPHGHESL